MAKLKWYAGNNGVYGYTDFSDMPRIFVYATSPNTYVSNRQFDEMNYTYDDTADIYWFQGKFTKNSAAATDGFVTGYTAYNKNGDIVMSGSGLNVDLANLLTDDGFGNYTLNGDFWTTMMAGGNTFVGANNLGGDDWIETGMGDDSAYGLDGSDWFVDNGGTDFYNGDSGNDYVFYSNWRFSSDPTITGINANLKTGQITGPDGYIDTTKSVESVVGTHLADNFIGNRANNTFRGEGGADTYSGGGGFDTLRFDKDAGRG